MAGPVLVTGATGFVGAAIVRALLARGEAVRVLARPASDRRNVANLHVEVAEGRLEDAASLRKAMAGCRVLIHTAADYRIWVPDPAAMMKANVEGTRTLMEAALAEKVERVVYTSSVATLGHVEGGVADEDTPSDISDKVGPYKQSKFLAEEVVRRMVAEQGLPAVICSPSTPIGPGDVKPTPTGRMIVEAASGRMPAYVDTGLNIVHVDDVAAGHLLALDKGRIGERYILGGENLTLADILNRIAKITGGRPPLMKLPRWPLYPLALGAETWARFFGGEPFVTVDGLKMSRWHMFFSSAKAERELGYRHRPADEALDAAVEWFKSIGEVP
ncbi:hopanoid-associated sugar epimerase [Paramagnetospirillum magneticum]|uniref:Nucleoside-diphosphate-sugar epimerase n=1 Tax=Paramagnetospirillum magneticum (strain ATCC 700264 / AMB-1) TaxID=342108 RepID=Q2W7K7_PARM1|nr:hopanoid-associated sugar epimerase [Paramagnetospirillum magneticum]BAE50168.1 Nucleoside-diphosphate-sugar epimerase [Paramagnetospirillum magneticum AMB-1]